LPTQFNFSYGVDKIDIKIWKKENENIIFLNFFFVEWEVDNKSYIFMINDFTYKEKISAFSVNDYRKILEDTSSLLDPSEYIQSVWAITRKVIENDIWNDEKDNYLVLKPVFKIEWNSFIFNWIHIFKWNNLYDFIKKYKALNFDEFRNRINIHKKIKNSLENDDKIDLEKYVVNLYFNYLDILLSYYIINYLTDNKHNPYDEIHNYVLNKLNEFNINKNEENIEKIIKELIIYFRNNFSYNFNARNLNKFFKELLTENKKDDNFVEEIKLTYVLNKWKWFC